MSFQNSDQNTPIPQNLPTVAGWKTHPVQDNGEKLVPLGAFTPYSKKKIVSQAIYYGETEHSPYHYGELDGAVITPFVRESIAEKLVTASEKLPRNMYLLILDAYRPLDVQKALYEDFYGQLLAKGMSPDEAIVEAQRFVSKPSDDPTRPSPHNTGGSVDLTIIQVDDETALEIETLDAIIAEHGDNDDMWKDVYEAEIKKMALLRNKAIELPMGTAFDEVCPATATAHFENKENPSAEDIEIRDNRRLLFNVMQEAGMSNYDEEWWHFDYGNQFDAIRNNKDAIYSTAVFDADCQKHENMMRDHHKGLAALTHGDNAARNAMGLFVQETGKLVLKNIGSQEGSALRVKAERLQAV